ncbi:putative craniofacial development protein 2-like [Xyrichtys novacula]|uniref:Craniofacial development protein 2-like n=1 Tax=Xyrichtys novacula TaxID=13765 RepID=A0AAV1EWX8_XYRNO|nr:putative craniofacial development protein 2-like [Xyrichtys novacula]
MTHRGQSQQDTLGLNRPQLHPKNIMKIGNWNVRTLNASGNITLAAREMTKKGMDILGISETHWTGQGKVELAGGETIIYSGRDDENHRQGVGILMSKTAARALIDWTPVNERIRLARYHSQHIKLTIIHIYAPTEDAEEQEKDKFYMRLQDVLDSRNKHDMLIITGDMNAKVGDGYQDYDGVMGKHGLEWLNNNGERLCDMNELVITGTQIDHTLINQRFRNSVNDTRVHRSADIGSDHYLVCTTIKLRLKKRHKERKSTRIKYDTAKLKNQIILKTFAIHLRNRYHILEEEGQGVEYEEVECDFQVMERAYVEVAEAVLGTPRKKKPWLSEESWSLEEAREGINKKILGTRSERVKKQLREKYAEKNKEVKRSIKADKRKWMEDIASEAEAAARKQHMKTLYGLYYNPDLTSSLTSGS